MEIDFSKLRGQVLRLTLAGFAVSFGIAVVVALLLKATGLIETPLLVAIILCATSLGVLVPVLKDAGQISSTFGQLIIAAGTIADFGAVILLSIFFSGEGGVGSTLLLIGGWCSSRSSSSSPSGAPSARWPSEPTCSGFRTRRPRSAFAAPWCSWSASRRSPRSSGLETILGAFMAGAILSLLDRDEAMTHPDFRRKLEAIGFGVFIPVFFVTSGVNYDLDALVASASNVIMVPIFLAALVARTGASGAALPAGARRRARPSSPG